MTLTEGTRYVIVVDGVEVVGAIVRRTNRYLAVKLIKPYGRLSTCLAIPLFALPFTSFDGEHGDDDARMLLEGLYRKAVLFDRHAEELRALWGRMKTKLIALQEALANAQDGIAASRRDLRNRFRRGELRQAEYQRCVRELRQRERSFDEQRRLILVSMDVEKPWTGDIDLRQFVGFLGEDTEGLQPLDELTIEGNDEH